jgi:hypothetical protein
MRTPHEALRPPLPTRANPLVRALGLSLGPLVALGLTRFAYALLLPSMRADLQSPSRTADWWLFVIERGEVTRTRSSASA